MNLKLENNSRQVLIMQNMGQHDSILIIRGSCIVYLAQNQETLLSLTNLCFRCMAYLIYVNWIKMKQTMNLSFHL